MRVLQGHVFERLRDMTVYAHAGMVFYVTFWLLCDFSGRIDHISNLAISLRPERAIKHAQSS